MSRSRIGDGVRCALSLACVVGCLMASRSFVVRSQAEPKADYGSAAPISGIDYRSHDHTIVLFVRSTCHFCSESMPFYERVASGRSKSGIQIVAISDEPVATTTNYLAGYGLKVDRVVQQGFGPFAISGTPTVVVVNRAGAIVGRWAGRQTAHGEKQVMSVAGL
jgi:hypothetical protein